MLTVTRVAYPNLRVDDVSLAALILVTGFSAMNTWVFWYLDASWVTWAIHVYTVGVMGAAGAILAKLHMTIYVDGLGMSHKTALVYLCVPFLIPVVGAGATIWMLVVGWGMVFGVVKTPTVYFFHRVRP